MDKLIALIKENNELLKEIKAMLQSCLFDSDKQDIKAFAINVAANIFYELLENDREFKETVKSNFSNL